MARQVLNENSDISGLEEVVGPAKLFLEAMEGIAARTRKIIWEVVPGLLATELFPSHVTHFSSNCFKDSSLLDMRKGVLLSTWSEFGRYRLHTVEWDRLLAVDFAATGVLIKFEDYAPHGCFRCVCYQAVW